MKITYKPYFDFPEVIHYFSAALEQEYPGISVWHPNETKDIPDDAKVRVNTDGTESYQTLTDSLLASADYVVADKGVNPNFQCAICSKPALQEFILDENDTNIPQRTIPIQIDGKRVCVDCFKQSANPQSIESNIA